jgi:hypothetical protein
MHSLGFFLPETMWQVRVGRSPYWTLRDILGLNRPFAGPSQTAALSESRS